jgi:hypothetical protein
LAFLESTLLAALGMTIGKSSSPQKREVTAKNGALLDPKKQADGQAIQAIPRLSFPEITLYVQAPSLESAAVTPAGMPSIGLRQSLYRP